MDTSPVWGTDVQVDDDDWQSYAVIITEADGTQNVVGPFDDELAATLAANGIETGTRFTQVTPMLAPEEMI